MSIPGDERAGRWREHICQLVTTVERMADAHWRCLYNSGPMTDITSDYQLRRDTVLLNHGSFGACPKPVFDDYQHWQRELEAHPGGFVARWHQRMDEARAPLAAYLGTTPDQLGFVTNATMGVNVIAHSLRSDLRESDQILSSDHEYGACNNTWAYTCSKTGARYIQRPMSLPVTTAEAWVEQFWAGVNPRTRVIYLSHISSPTALTFPITEICRRARAAGILTVIDGAHVPGQRELKLEDIGADFYTGNCHKWMGTPKGSAFLYVRKDRQHLIEPLIVGHGWHAGQVSEKPLVDYVEQFGTRDLAAFLTLPAAIAYMHEHNWAEVRSRCFKLACDTRHRIEDMLDTEPLCPDDPAWFSQMVAVRLPDRLNAAKLGQALRDQHKIEIPVFPWNGVNIMRLSVQAYTTQAELDILVDAVGRHAKECIG